MKLKYLLTVPLTISIAALLSACNNSNNDNPVQSNSGYIDNNGSQYQYPPTNSPITNTDALAVGAVGVATGVALGKYANKPNTSYGKPVVVVNKHYYQTKPKVRVSRYKRK